MFRPSCGEVWFVDLDPTLGAEIRGERPCLVVSVDSFNHGPVELVIVLPITTTDTGIPFHVRIDPPEGGVRKPSFVKTEQPQCITPERLTSLRGNVSAETMTEVEDRLQILLGL